MAETPEEHLNTVDAGLYYVFEVAKAACNLVAAQDHMLPNELPPDSWDVLVSNRDEHGPDIPTKDLDWRSKL